MQSAGSCQCSFRLDIGYQHESWLQSPRNWLPCSVSFSHSIHSTGKSSRASLCYNYLILWNTGRFPNKSLMLVLLQDGTSHYMKGVVLLLCYVVIGACFFVSNGSTSRHFLTTSSLNPSFHTSTFDINILHLAKQGNGVNLGLNSSSKELFRIW